FFEDDRRGRGGIVLTDHLLALPADRAIQHGNLRHEVEARWRLVETAWSLNLPPRQLQVRFDDQTGDLSIVAEDRRRRSVTQARHALDGYQRGRCFYCGREISLEADTLNAEVDHVFPWILPSRGLNIDIDGIWNL
ncbi:HNH endonuclease domain-containing protein, partial [Deinococcus sp. 23YEL01]|uniref:HNH endonuclease domain-containing protein n=1 Tax=Deinococcus sp. 23YEL01 TaxID=2745871 RepID=UPI001E33318B